MTNATRALRQTDLPATPNPAIALLEQRVSASRFDPGHVLADTEIAELTRLATLAPSAYHLQNWKIIAVRTAAAKATLRRLAFGQAKVSEAAVTFILIGQLPDHLSLAERLRPFVELGHMPAEMVADWQGQARAQYADPLIARDEAIRSASLAAAMLIEAASALGLASCPMGGFNPAGVASAFDLGPDEVPVMLVAVGRAADGNWPRKPRRKLAEILDIR